MQSHKYNQQVASHSPAPNNLRELKQLALLNVGTFSDLSAALTSKEASLKQTSPTGILRVKSALAKDGKKTTATTGYYRGGKKVGGYFVEHEENRMSNSHAEKKQRKNKQQHSGPSILG